MTEIRESFTLSDEQFAALRQRGAREGFVIHENCGTLTRGGFSFDYLRAGEVLTVMCTRKPRLVPGGLVRAKLKSFIRELQGANL